MINLEHLTEEERNIILDVLRRDEALRQAEQDRVKKLKNELHELRKKAAVKIDDGSVSASSSSPSNKNVCARCREPLGSLFGSGEVCSRCQHKVCNNCKVFLPSGKKWLCTVCNKQFQIRLGTGGIPGLKQEEDKEALYGSELVRASLTQTTPKGNQQEPKVIVTSGPTSPADSGYNGRRANISSMGESTEASTTTYDDEYPSDASYDHSAASGVESIGPSVSQRGGVVRHNEDGTLTRNDAGKHYVSDSENEVSLDLARTAEITLEPVSAADIAGNHTTYHSDNDEVDHYHGNVNYEHDSLSEDNRSYHSRDYDRKPVPKIAIQDAGDDASDEEYYSRTAHPRNPALEATQYRDALTGEFVTFKNGQIVRSEEEYRSDNTLDDHDATPQGSVVAGYDVGEDGEPRAIPEISVAFADIHTELEENSQASATTVADIHTETEENSQASAATIAVDDREKEQDKHPEAEEEQSYRKSTHSSVMSPVERKASGKSGMLSKPTGIKRIKKKGSSSSLTSLYSTGEEFYGKYQITGDINFGLNYNFKTNVFEIKVVACRDLVPIEAKKNKSDPYVKTYLLPDKSKNSKRKTKTKKGTINPQFNECLKYHIAQSELETRTLSVAVWHNDRFGHNMFLGEVTLPLDSIQLSIYPQKWHQLLPRVPPTEKKPMSYKGDLVLALMFETSGDNNGSANGSKYQRKKAKQIVGCLKLHIKEGKNLTSSRMSGTTNPYVKAYLEPDRSKGGKKKTAVMKNTSNPVFEQSFEFPNMTEEILKERALEVGVWDHDTLASHSFLGGVRLGLGSGKSYGRSVPWQDATGMEIQLWEQMMQNHNHWVEACLTLRPSFDKKS